MENSLTRNQIILIYLLRELCGIIEDYNCSGPVKDKAEECKNFLEAVRIERAKK